MIGLGLGIGMGGQRAPRWTPASVTGYALDLDASVGVTLASGVVSAWADQSPTGHNATQGTALQRPGYSASYAPFGGAPAILGVTNTNLAISHTFGAANTIIVVAKPATQAGYLCTSANSNNALIFSRLDGTKTEWFNSASDRVLLTSDAASAHVFAIRQADGSKLEMFCDGVAGVVKTPPAVGLNGIAWASLLGQTTGGTAYVGGAVGRILHYTAALSDADLLRVTRYVGAANAITVA